MSAGAASGEPAARWPDRFVTAQLQAAPLDEGDGALFAALYGDAATMAHVGPALSPVAASRAFAAARRQMQGERPCARYWRLDGAGPALGLLSLVVDPGRVTAETGVLLNAAGRGRGLAADALSGLLSAVLRADGLDAVWTRHRAAHGAAAGLMHALRFAPVEERDGWLRWRMDRARWSALAAAKVSV